MKALIIDDEAGFRIALAHFLRSRGYDAVEAESGATGLNLALQSPPDLVFLDYRLPCICVLKRHRRLSDYHTCTKIVLASNQKAHITV